jgi:hypothetical protein
MAQWIEAPDQTWVQFPDEMPAADIEKAMQQAYPPTATPVPDVPLQPVPTQPDWTQDPRAQAEAASAATAVSPPIEIPPAGTEGDRRASILPISHHYVTDEAGRAKDTGWDWAVPGMLYDIPEQTRALGSHPLGTEYTDEEIGSMLGLAGFGAGGGIGRNAKSVLAREPKINKDTIFGELQSNIKTEQARNPNKSKHEIFVEEALKIKKAYGKYLNKEQSDKFDEVIQRSAGATRQRIEKTAGKTGLSFGFNPTEILATTMASSISPGTAGTYAGARFLGGLTTKGVIQAAKMLSKGALKQDLRDIRKLVTFNGKTGRVTTSSKGKVEATRKDFEGHPDTAVRSGRQPTEAEVNATTTPGYVPPTQPRPTSPISLGGTKMTTGDPIKKTTGTDPRFLYEQQQAQQAAAARAKADELRATPNAQPVPSGGTASPIPERFASGATSPIPKAESSVVQQLKERFFGGGGKVVKPLPKVKPGSKGPQSVISETPEGLAQTKSFKEHQKKLAEAQKEMADVKKLPRGADRDTMMESLQKRIDFSEERIAQMEGKLESQKKSALSEAEHKAIMDTPPEYRSLEQQLEMKKRAYDESRHIDDSQERYYTQSDLRVEMAELEAEIAKSNLTPEVAAARARWEATKAAEAEAKKNARSPQSVLAEQKAIMDVEEAVASTVPKAVPKLAPTVTTPKAARVKKAVEPEPTEFEPVIKKSSSGVSLSGVAPKAPRVAKKSAARAERMTKTKRVTQTEARLAQRMADELATKEGVEGIQDFIKSQKKGAPLDLDVPKKKPRSGKASGRGKRVY